MLPLDKSLLNRLRVLDNGGRFPHAVLISGDKAFDFALLAAEYLLCESDDGKPCGVCAACVKIGSRNHPDVAVFEGGSKSHKSFHIDRIRQLRKDAYMLPNESDVKVYILRDVQNMTEQAANALLKILEEPPPFVVFLLTCENCMSLPKTIISRVVRVDIGGTDAPGSTKAFELAERIAVCAAQNPKELLICTSELVVSKDKTLVGEVFSHLRDIFHAAILEVSAPGSRKSGECSQALANSFDLKQLNNMILLLDRIDSYIKSNANKNLLIAYFCDSIRKIKG